MVERWTKKTPPKPAKKKAVRQRWTMNRDNSDFEQFMKAYHPPPPEESRYDYYCSLSLEEVLREFENWMRYERGYSKQTIPAKRKKVQKFFKITGVELKDVDKEVRKAHRAYLIEQMRKGKLKKNYVSTILVDLNVFFCHFLGRKDLRIPSIGREEISFERLTRDDIDAMIDAVDERKDIKKKEKVLHKMILVTLWNELPRISEFCSLKLRDIDEVSRKVRFSSRKRDRAPAHLRHPFATKEFLKAWNEYKKYRDSDDWSPEAPAIVQVDHGGMPVSILFVRRMLKGYAARAGIDKRITPHIVRKSGGTELSMENPKLGQMQLGHKSIRTTLTNYTGPNEEDKMRIDGILTPQKKVTVEEVVEQLTKQFVKDELPEEEYLYAIKSLKKNRGVQNLENKDIAFM